MERKNIIFRRKGIGSSNYPDFHNSAESHLQAPTAKLTALWLPSIKRNQMMHDITYQSAYFWFPRYIRKFELDADGKRWNMCESFY